MQAMQVRMSRLFELGILLENLIDGETLGEHAEHQRDPDAVPTDARLPPTDGRVDRDPLQRFCLSPTHRRAQADS